MMVASKDMFLYGGRGLVTYFGAVGKRGRWDFTIK
jgi:hypothetical protein